MIKTAYRLTRDDNRKILSLVVPAMIERLLSLTFGAIDTMMLGHSKDAVVALSAVGISQSIVNLVICVLFGYVVGMTATTAFYIGAKEEKKLGDFVRQTCFVHFVVSVTLSVVFYKLSGAMVDFLNPADADIRAAAKEYYRIVAVGFGFQFVMMTVGGFLRGCSKNKMSLIYSVASNIVNVGLNYLLIFGKYGFPEMGIKGAALATTISQGVGALISVILLITLNFPARLRFNGSFIPRWELMRRAVKIGITGGLEEFLIQMGNVLYVKIIAQLPKLDLSANSVVQTINGYVWGCAGSLKVASTTLMGVSVGEKREDKCIAFTKRIYRSGALIGAVVCALMITFRHLLCGLISDNAEVVEYAASLLAVTSTMAVSVGIHFPLSGALRAAGDTSSPFYASVVSFWIVRMGLAILFIKVMHLGLVWGWVSAIAEHIVRAIMNYIPFVKGKWKRGLTDGEII